MRRLNWTRFLILWAITAGTIAMVGILIQRLGKRTMIAGVSALIQDRPRSE